MHDRGERERLELVERLKVRLECGCNVKVVSTEGKGKTSLGFCMSIMYERIQKTWKQ